LYKLTDTHLIPTTAHYYESELGCTGYVGRNVTAAILPLNNIELRWVALPVLAVIYILPMMRGIAIHIGKHVDDEFCSILLQLPLIRQPLFSHLDAT
jgi:hypothetical protein